MIGKRGRRCSDITGEHLFIVATIEHDGSKYTVTIREGSEFNCVLCGDEIKILFDESCCGKNKRGFTFTSVKKVNVTMPSELS